jgi:hypothetical protein
VEQKKSNKLLLIFIFIITAILAGAAVWIGWRLSQEKEVTPTPSEAGIIWDICGPNGADVQTSCGGGANSGVNCNGICAPAIPDPGYMWTCDDEGGSGVYRCYMQTANEDNFPDVPGEQCYCHTNPCTDPANWGPCGCDLEGCYERCLVEIGNNAHHIVTWECGDTAGSGCRQYFSCECFQQTTTTPPTTTTTTPPTTTTTTPPTTTTTTPPTTTTTTPPTTTTTTPATTTTTPVTTTTTTPVTTTTTPRTTTTTIITTTSAPRVGVFDDALSSTKLAIILIVFEPLIDGFMKWTERPLPETIKKRRKEKFEKKLLEKRSKAKQQKI